MIIYPLVRVSKHVNIFVQYLESFPSWSCLSCRSLSFISWITRSPLLSNTVVTSPRWGGSQRSDGRRGASIFIPFMRPAGSRIWKMEWRNCDVTWFSYNNFIKIMFLFLLPNVFREGKSKTIYDLSTIRNRPSCCSLAIHLWWNWRLGQHLTAYSLGFFWCSAEYR